MHTDVSKKNIKVAFKTMSNIYDGTLVKNN